MREGILKGDRVQIIRTYTYRARGVKWELATPVNVLTADMRMSSPPGVIEDLSTSRASVYGSRTDTKCL